MKLELLFLMELEENSKVSMSLSSLLSESAPIMFIGQTLLTHVECSDSAFGISHSSWHCSCGMHAFVSFLETHHQPSVLLRGVPTQVYGRHSSTLAMVSFRLPGLISRAPRQIKQLVPWQAFGHLRIVCVRNSQRLQYAG